MTSNLPIPEGKLVFFKKRRRDGHILVRVGERHASFPRWVDPAFLPPDLVAKFNDRPGRKPLTFTIRENDEGLSCPNESECKYVSLELDF